uniref:G patch domain-containing protein 11-like n=1 Tax=Ciona intestinalis TaxID=7719 RepID=UPI00006A3AC3|nr:G patch domain-containing protein 11-like [Ciona intestinalis]|eukprot:XP_002129492.1 G patch domain-containing protein 11-like [Ciona intestinalis]
MGDEDDYMSDIFTNNIQEPKVSLKPGVSNSRKRTLEKRRAHDVNKSKPKKVIELETREKGLATEIGQDNKGFKMMAMMGYKKGEGLGKGKTGRIEPVPISVKANRTGLGKDELEKQRKAARKKMETFMLQQRAKVEHNRREDFRFRMSEKFALQLLEKDLNKSQKACHTLDSAGDVTEPEMYFYWPEMCTSPEEEEEKEDQHSVNEKLVLITEYLRTKYFYCIWCATKYNDLNDIKSNCPGDTANSHDDFD